MSKVGDRKRPGQEGQFMGESVSYRVFFLHLEYFYWGGAGGVSLKNEVKMF